jgi:signal transduction histidine kinase
MGDPFEISRFPEEDSTQKECSPLEPKANPSRPPAVQAAVLDALSEGVLLRDLCGNVTFCNEAAARMLGVECRGTVPQECTVLLARVEHAEAGVSRGADYLPEHVASSTGAGEEKRLFSVNVNGAPRWIRPTAKPVFDTNGAVAGSITLLTDVTENTRLHEAVRAGAQRLELSLEAGNVGVWELDPDTDTGWWSPNLNRLFTLGLRTRGFAGLVAHVHPEDRFSLLTNATQVFHGKIGDRLTLEFRIVQDQDEIRWVRLDGCLTASTTGRVMRGTLVDITERWHIEDQLRKAQRLESIGRLAGGVAHDFNNLLAAMLSTLDLLDPERPESLREDLASLRDITLRGRDLTRRLLAFAKRPSMERKVVDIAELIASVEVLLMRLVGPNILLQVSVAEALPVRGDFTLLEQLVVSLVVFARDTIPRGGQLSLLAERQNNDGRFSEMGDTLAMVTLSCTCLDPADCPGSAQLAADGTRALAAAEFGLENSRAVAQQHGGTLTLRDSPGQGVQLTLMLPCLPTRLEDRPTSTRSNRPLGRRGKVLIVEDEDVVRDNLVRLTRMLGYQVDGATGAAQALAALDERDVAWDVVLCDIGIPGPDGPSLVSLLKQRAPSLRVVYMSGYTAEAESQRADGELFLSKPFGRDELARALALSFQSR